MPVIQSAKRKVRVDQRREIVNLRVKREYKKALRDARKNPSEENIKKAYSAFDTAAKKNVIHKNKASRLKSRLAKLSSKLKQKR